MGEKVKVDTIGDIPVYYLRGKFTAEKDGVHFEALGIEALKMKMQGLDKKAIRVISFYIYVAGGYETDIDIFDAIAHSKKFILRVNEDGKKERISSEHLYVHTPELEQKLAALLQKAKDLRSEIETTLRTAKRFP